MVHSGGTRQAGAQVSTYLDDTCTEHVDTRVIMLGDRDGLPWAAVEHCLFHPQAGGRPADRGWLTDADVIPVRNPESTLVVLVAPEGGALPPVTVGQSVRTRIDMRTRMTHAALHTAGHLVEAVGRRQGWEMVSNNHFPGQARIEFRVPPSDARLADPEGREEATSALRAAVAAAAAEDLPVFPRYEGAGRRVGYLDASHAAPCGGTHLRSLGAPAEVVLPTFKVKKGRIRVSCSATPGSH